MGKKYEAQRVFRNESGMLSAELVIRAQAEPFRHLVDVVLPVLWNGETDSPNYSFEFDCLSGNRVTDFLSDYQKGDFKVQMRALEEAIQSNMNEFRQSGKVFSRGVIKWGDEATSCSKKVNGLREVKGNRRRTKYIDPSNY